MPSAPLRCASPGDRRARVLVGRLAVGPRRRALSGTPRRLRLTRGMRRVGAHRRLPRPRSCMGARNSPPPMTAPTITTPGIQPTGEAPPRYQAAAIQPLAQLAAPAGSRDVRVRRRPPRAQQPARSITSRATAHGRWSPRCWFAASTMTECTCTRHPRAPAIAQVPHAAARTSPKERSTGSQGLLVARRRRQCCRRTRHRPRRQHGRVALTRCSTARLQPRPAPAGGSGRRRPGPARRDRRRARSCLRVCLPHRRPSGAEVVVARPAACSASAPTTPAKGYANTIPLMAPPEQQAKLVRRVVTESRAPQDPKGPDTCTLVASSSPVADPAATPQVRDRYRTGGSGYGDVKALLAEQLHTTLAPMRDPATRRWWPTPPGLTRHLRRASGAQTQRATVPAHGLPSAMGLCTAAPPAPSRALAASAWRRASAARASAARRRWVSSAAFPSSARVAGQQVDGVGVAVGARPRPQRRGEVLGDPRTGVCSERAVLGARGWRSRARAAGERAGQHGRVPPPRPRLAVRGRGPGLGRPQVGAAGWAARRRRRAPPRPRAGHDRAGRDERDATAAPISCSAASRVRSGGGLVVRRRRRGGRRPRRPGRSGRRGLCARRPGAASSVRGDGEQRRRAGRSTAGWAGRPKVKDTTATGSAASAATLASKASRREAWFAERHAEPLGLAGQSPRALRRLAAEAERPASVRPAALRRRRLRRQARGARGRPGRRRVLHLRPAAPARRRRACTPPAPRSGSPSPRPRRRARPSRAEPTP